MSRLLFWFALLSPGILSAQLVLLAPGGSPVGSVYTLPTVLVGSSEQVQFQAQNQGSTSITVPLPTAPGAGFSVVNTASLYIIAPGQSETITVQFAPLLAGTSSANLQVSTVTVTLVAQGVSPPFSVSAPCVLNGTNLSFGQVGVGGQVICSLLPAGPQALTATTTGAGFSTSTSPSGQETILFNPSAPIAYSGTLTVGPLTYALTGQGYAAALPTPVLTFDSHTLSSNEQHTLTISLPEGTVGSGNATLIFTPAPNTANDDVSVQFVADSARLLSFNLTNGQASAVFSTGTTAGMLDFSVHSTTAAFADASARLTIAPQTISIESASATALLNELDLTVVGFDNTYSIGPMGFTFYDTKGNPIGPPVQANFAGPFQTYFQQQKAGSSFLMRLSFPVQGSAAAVGGVEAVLSNSAGSSVTQKLSFPPFSP